MPHTEQIGICSLYLVVYNGLHRSFTCMYIHFASIVYVPTCSFLSLRLYFVYHVWLWFLRMFGYVGRASALRQADRVLRHYEQRRVRTYLPTSVSSLSFPTLAVKRIGLVAMIFVTARTLSSQQCVTWRLVISPRPGCGTRSSTPM